ncbi:MAG TPA: glycosyltransferase [Arenimonas sp.]|nr:glycosyltransferase [Arenimonas sp.]
MLFHRNFLGYTGGHGKVFDYYQHALAHAGWQPVVWFRHGAEHRDNPWRQHAVPGETLWRPDAADALFLAGRDWQSYPEDIPGVPVINLVQHVRHADPHSPAHAFLGRRAVRICVSHAVADAIRSTGRVNGPVEVIEAALRMPASLLPPSRRHGVFIGALKQQALGRELARRLIAAGHAVDLCDNFVARDDYLRRMGSADIAVLLPNVTEGFYLPALEAMALGCATVVPDCIGNRAYLQPERNALTPLLHVDSLVAAVERLREASLAAALRHAGRETADRFSLESERAAFHRILDRLHLLWQP